MAIDLLQPTRRDVARIERAAADALGPDEEVVLDGWRLRANAGVARRANSALPPLADEPTAISGRRAQRAWSRYLRAVESFHRQRGIVPRVQLSVASPPGLDARLEREAWRREDGAVVMLGRTASAPLPSAQQPSALQPSVPPAPSDAERPIVVTVRPSEPWLALQEAVTPGRGAWARRRADVLAEQGRSAWHALLHEPDGRPVAAGLAVLDRTMRCVGLFAFVTATDARRRGHARRLLGALLVRAGNAGASQAYLQVHPDNASAISLYRSTGFREHHRYHYRRAAASG